VADELKEAKHFDLARRVGHFQQDPTLTRAFYRKLVHDQQPDPHASAFFPIPPFSSRDE